MQRRGLLLFAGLGALAAVAPARGESALERLLGIYVGTARVEDARGELVEKRDLDVTIAPFRRTGFRLHTITVSLVDGRRDVPGVVRRESETRFLPAAGRPYFVEVRDPGPFRPREEFQPMAGDPVRWAVVDAEGLHTFAFVLLDDGRFELQVSHRLPIPGGLELRFVRLLDGQPVRRVVGRVVRVRE